MRGDVRLDERLSIPDGTEAVLWDMDGVLVDSLSLDYEITNGLLQKHVAPDLSVRREVIREAFPLAAEDYWSYVLKSLRRTYPDEQLGQLAREWEDVRKSTRFALNPGIPEVLAAIRDLGLKTAVVSNNKTADIEQILDQAGIRPFFDAVVGNDFGNTARKPAPDTYLRAGALLGVTMDRCVVVEDSLIGARAARAAGAFSVGVATGACTFDELLASPDVDVCYTSFTRRRVSLTVGQPLNKLFATPNEFVSHMVEHIAWRMNAAIVLEWPSSDWRALGAELGARVRLQGSKQDSSAVVGMIDDGSAEVFAALDEVPSLTLEGRGEVAIDHFLSLRCEQLPSGEPLRQLLDGITEGLGAALVVRVCSLEDPHHTWEGVFRAVGIALNKMFGADQSGGRNVRALCEDAGPADLVTQGAGMLRVEALSETRCRLARKTAESEVTLDVALSDDPGCDAVFEVSDTIDVSGMPGLLAAFARAAGLRVDVRFSATKLSSSHVVLEDTALLLGAGLFKIIERRMAGFGINGAGSSLRTKADFDGAAVAAAVSVEGRKFLKLVPFDVSFGQFRRDVILGRTAYGSVRSEDVDDFLDALAGGMRASIVVHFRKCASSSANALLEGAVEGAGMAVREALEVNVFRRGLPPGVKATLL